jgi:hypothetical protein
LSRCPTARLPAGVQVAAYFTIAETLTNAMKDARAETATVRASITGGHLVVEVAGDGVGGADAGRGSGCAVSPTDRGARRPADDPHRGRRGTTVQAMLPTAF